MADQLSSPLETDFDQCGAALVGSVGSFIILPSPYTPIVSPENFTAYVFPRGWLEG